MSLFTKYRPKDYQFFEPERLTPAESSLRRTQAIVREHERQLKWLDEGLSPVAKNRVNLAARLVNDPQRMGQKAASIAAALKTFKESDFADPQQRAAYRELRRSQGGQQKVPPSGSDKRRFNPTGKDFAPTISGTAARLNPWTAIGAQARSSWSPAFHRPSQVIPCIQRSVRRQVMFAKGYGGKGYRVKHRRNWSSGVPC